MNEFFNKVAGSHMNPEVSELTARVKELEDSILILAEKNDELFKFVVNQLKRKTTIGQVYISIFIFIAIVSGIGALWLHFFHQ